MRILAFLILLMLFFVKISLSQSYSLSGKVFNSAGEPLSFSSVVLLNPVDSTMEFFGITNTEGNFRIKNIDKGKYNLQVAFLGYETFSKSIQIPREEGSNIGIIALKQKDISLDEINVTAERIPFFINRDTIEFNLSSFKIKPNAVTEDLLKKLPGIEIDRSGNIKALGEDIDRLLVDGKEFFGNDPKVATRNIPADALDKVQVYDKKSDEAEFTGLDDGRRDKTLNLVLKEDRKNAVFGNVLLGGGYTDYYKSSAKVYRFTNNVQLAALGMVNNVNQFGFSFSDYMNFNGGLGGLGAGHGMAKIRFGPENSFPINFGQPVDGILTSGAGGVNFSKSKGKNNRFFISYLGNASQKEKLRNSYTENYLEDEKYIQTQDLDENLENAAHRINIGIRNRLNTNHNLILNGEFASTFKDVKQQLNSSSTSNSEVINTLESRNSDNSDKLMFAANGSFISKMNSNKSVIKILGSGIYSNEMNSLLYESTTNYPIEGLTDVLSQFQKNTVNKLQYDGTISFAQKLSNTIFTELNLKYNFSEEELLRKHGIPAFSDSFIDSLSPEIVKYYSSLTPEISIKRNTDKLKISLGLGFEKGDLIAELQNQEIRNSRQTYFLPGFLTEWQYKAGRRINFSYVTMVNTPSVNQLLPVQNNLNPLYTYEGNPSLKPEYLNDLSLSWWIFDQFSFTSLLMTLNFNETENKINWSHTINDNLHRQSTLINTKKESEFGGQVDFSTPIRSLGMKINLSAEQMWSSGINYVNQLKNINDRYSQRYSFSIDNRKKDKIDIITGIGIDVTNSKYTIQSSLNNTYYKMSWFGEVRYTIIDNFNFEFIADVTNYTAQSFDKEQVIPLLTAELSYEFLKYNRGSLIFSVYDILDKNTIIQRSSELNYLQEVNSNTIGRYFLLSFIYQLNKFGSKNGGVDVQVKNR